MASKMRAVDGFERVVVLVMNRKKPDLTAELMLQFDLDYLYHQHLAVGAAVFGKSNSVCLLIVAVIQKVAAVTKKIEKKEVLLKVDKYE